MLHSGLYHRKDKKRMSETICPFSGKECKLDLCELYCHDELYTYGVCKCAITSLGYDIAGIRAELYKLNEIILNGIKRHNELLQFIAEQVAK